MRDSMPVLAVLDIENVQIKAYNGTGGTRTTSTTYSTNTMPQESFSTSNFSPIDGMQGNPILKTVILPSSLKVIGSYAFSQCRGLTHLPQIPNQVTTIETQAFSGCYGATGGLSIPNSVTTIGDNAFQSCRELTGNLILPKGLTTLGYGAFDGCSFTGILKIPEGITNILEWTFQGNNFTGIIFPSNLKSIQYDAFASDTAFSGDLILPNSVTTITYGFRGCRGFTACYIPSSVILITTDKIIGGFTGNKDFKKIAINKTTPLTINNLTFDGVDKKSCELIVPTGSKAAYQTADGWKDFSIITEAIFVTLNTLGGNPAAPITTTTANTTITKPDNPAREGYSFDSWYKEAACTNAWDFATDIITTPITLYAKWTANPVNSYTVNFAVDGGSAVADIVATNNSTITKPTDPAKIGYIFAGWYKDAACTNVWDFATDVVTANITLYAKWTFTTFVEYQQTLDFMGYPNPAKDKFYINFDSPNFSGAIFDLQGKKVVDIEAGINPIDISSLYKGIYLVKVVDSGNIKVVKLIKE